MAHKHNRRRTRPRHRTHSSLNPTFDISDHISESSSDSSSLSDSSCTGSIPRQRPLLTTPRHSTTSVASKHWHNRYVAWQTRDENQKQEAAKIEDEQLKLFGGERGDDVGLCYKMMEVFKGMDWVDSLD